MKVYKAPPAAKMSGQTLGPYALSTIGGANSSTPVVYASGFHCGYSPSPQPVAIPSVAVIPAQLASVPRIVVPPTLIVKRQFPNRVPKAQPLISAVSAPVPCMLPRVVLSPVQAPRSMLSKELSSCGSPQSPQNGLQPMLLTLTANPPKAVSVGHGITPEYAHIVAKCFEVGFDNSMYDKMGADVQRVTSYNRAIVKAVAGKKVLDVGTGRDALLALMCARAGAEQVTAVEIVPAVAASAREAVKAAGFDSVVKVVEGHSGVVPLPPVDIIVHEIVGGLAGEEGMAAAIRDLQNRPEVVNSLRPGWSIPRYVETRIAPLAARPGSLAWGQATANATGLLLATSPLELTFNRLARMPTAPAPADLLGSLQRLEFINAEAPVEPFQEGTLRWRFGQEAAFEGFACAPWLDLDGECFADAWLGGTSWQHKLLGLESPVLVKPGDEVLLSFSVDLCAYPVRYGFKAALHRANYTA